MTNQFSRFEHTSPLSSIPHSPPITLASNCIRDFFGPAVQLVADCLQSRGGTSTLAQIVSTINAKPNKKSRTEERRKLFRALKLKESDVAGTANVPAIRAALLALIQHSIVIVRKSTVTTSKKKKTVYTYEYKPGRARILIRYPRFIEYTKKALDETAATLIEELLVNGRMRTADAIKATVEQLNQMEEGPRSDRYTYRQAVLESFRRLVKEGFLQQVAEVVDDEEEEHTLDLPPNKKRRVDSKVDTDDPAVVDLLQSGPYKFLPRDAIWRVNVKMFHDSLRAVSLGVLVAERYGQKVQFAGSMVSAALRLVAFREHGEKVKDFESQTMFTAENIMRFLPKQVFQNLDKKAGGALPNLHRALVELAAFRNPVVLEEMEVSDGHPENAKFHIATRKLVQFLQNRIIHQVILDSHGEIAARICSILRVNGHLEADAIAKSAMVPARDTREVLHLLYRDNFIDLFNINQGRQHNPASMIYLWTVSRPRSIETVTDNVCTALLNMRLRRQHEVEVGREWIERAKEAGATDENENETDKLNYTRFCQGLERLEKAALQLDETLMVLKEF